jgi:hypothetical protein
MAELEGLAAEGITMDDVGFDAAALTDLGALSSQQEQEPTKGSTEEIDVDSFEMDHKCPRCGFEFNTKPE